MAMADPISYPGILTATLLPWLVGCILVHLLLAGSKRWNWFVVAGHGYFAGVFITTFLIRFWNWWDVELRFWPLAAILLALAAAGLLARVYRPHRDIDRARRTTMPGWHRVVIALLICLLAWRYLTIFQEVMIRPLYAWDAWMNWAPKAIVWFHHNALTPFVSPEQWLQQGSAGPAYTLGNSQASLYPATVSLIQLWSMMGIGTWDHSYLYLPWVLVPIAIGLALYGHLRLAGVSVLASTLACYLLLNLPYLNVHTALPGYADIWLASTFGLAMFAFHEWQLNRHWRYMTLCLFMTYFCSQLKNPGIVLGLILVIAILRSRLNLGTRVEVSLGIALMVLVISLLVFGFSADIPILGHLSVGGHEIELPLFGSFSLEYHPVSSAFIESLLVMINWNLLSYLLILFIAVKLYRGDMARQASSESFILFASAMFIVFVFYFTRHYYAALNFVTLNRALLYPVPALIFYLFLHLQQPDPRHQSSSNCP
jgi:hypothetical protein